MPKSVTFAAPSSSTRTFWGLTSRCTMPRVVGDAERAGDLDGVGDRLGHRQAAEAADAVLQRLALDVLEDDVRRVVVLAGVDDGDDVRVVELRDGPRLAPEALELVGVRRDLAVHQLDRDLALEHGVEGAIDRRHPARADLGVEPVAAVEQGADLRAHVSIVLREEAMSKNTSTSRRGSPTPRGPTRAARRSMRTVRAGGAATVVGGLLQQPQDVLRGLVGLREHRRAGLLEDLVLGQVDHLLGHVDVADARLGARSGSPGRWPGPTACARGGSGPRRSSRGPGDAGDRAVDVRRVALASSSDRPDASTDALRLKVEAEITSPSLAPTWNEIVEVVPAQQLDAVELRRRADAARSRRPAG